MDILNDKNSPFLFSRIASDKQELKIILKRWVKNQLEGQESKVFSQSEESEFKNILQEYAYKDNKKGFINNKEARQVLGMSVDSQSEAVQLSKLFQRWAKSGFLKKGSKRGDWKITEKPKSFSSNTLKEWLQSIHKNEKNN